VPFFKQPVKKIDYFPIIFLNNRFLDIDYSHNRLLHNRFFLLTSPISNFKSLQSTIDAFEKIFGQISFKVLRFSPELWDISPNFSPNTLYMLSVCTCKYKNILKYKIQILIIYLCKN
jgi:hypothetical protein